MATQPNILTKRLLDLGLSEELVDASIPDWWQTAEQGSPSARALVSMLLARRLSIDPETLLDDAVPVGFLHTGPTKFKHMRLADGVRRDALVAFAHGVTRILLSVADASPAPAVPANPLDLRNAILASGRPFVSFGDVLTACWSLGVPVLHLRLFPAKTKGVTAIAVRIGGRHAILVARESGYEAQYMFHLAHELGHIALGHLTDVSAIVDADPLDSANDPEELVDDEEERAADGYAQALLTGSESFEVVRQDWVGSGTKFGTARELAERAIGTGSGLGVDPGHIIMCFGYSTGDWQLANAAAKLLPSQAERPGTMVNKVLWGQLGTGQSDSQAVAYLSAVAPI